MSGALLREAGGVASLSPSPRSSGLSSSSEGSASPRRARPLGTQYAPWYQSYGSQPPPPPSEEEEEQVVKVSASGGSCGGSCTDGSAGRLRPQESLPASFAYGSWDTRVSVQEEEEEGGDREEDEQDQEEQEGLLTPSLLT